MASIGGNHVCVVYFEYMDGVVKLTGTRPREEECSRSGEFFGGKICRMER